MRQVWRSAFVILNSCILLIACQSNPKNKTKNSDLEVRVVGALKNVMQKGELQARIDLDTLSNKEGLYGLGPEAYLTGELLLIDGSSYVSRVLPDSSIVVNKTFNTSAPFFVYTHIKDWESIDLPSEVRTISELEEHLLKLSTESGATFAFMLSGKAGHAVFHIQNLPKGTLVNSPQEAHQGQVNFELNDEDVAILGFFSTAHQGIFTHHDSYVHMHLITKDASKMGHLDELEIGQMKLFLTAE